jgi:hypothetical protein
MAITATCPESLGKHEHLRQIKDDAGVLVQHSRLKEVCWESIEAYKVMKQAVLSATIVT